MPFSLLVTGYPKDDVPVTHVQGPALQGMFLNLMGEVDPAVAARLHDDSRYRPYTLSPLGVEMGARGNFQGFQLPRHQMLRRETPCYLRVTLLDDALFPTFARYFLDRAEPTFQLVETEFLVTNVIATSEQHPYVQAATYDEMIARAQRAASQRRFRFSFLTPTSFRTGDIDMPLPIPRLVFQSYLRRFQEYHPYPFLPEIETLIEQQTGVAEIRQLHTEILRTKNVPLVGFVGDVTFEISKHAPPEFIVQMNLLANFAMFCGTGRKTTVGMGQTILH